MASKDDGFELRRFALWSVIVLFGVSGMTTAFGAVVSGGLADDVRVELVLVGVGAMLTGVIVAALRQAAGVRSPC